MHNIYWTKALVTSTNRLTHTHSHTRTHTRTHTHLLIQHSLVTFLVLLIRLCFCSSFFLVPPGERLFFAVDDVFDKGRWSTSSSDLLDKGRLSTSAAGDLLDEGRSSISSSGKFSCSASWSLRRFLWDLLKPLVLLFFTESAVCSSDFLRESKGKEMIIQRFSYCCRYICVVVKSVSDVPTNQFVVLILCLSECYHSYSGCGQYSTASGHSINTVITMESSLCRHGQVTIHKTLLLTKARFLMQWLCFVLHLRLCLLLLLLLQLVDLVSFRFLLTAVTSAGDWMPSGTRRS